MLYVIEVRLTSSTGIVNYFDIVLSSGVHIASCGRAESTQVNGQVTANLSSYQTLSGDLTFSVIFDAGGRIETTDAARDWSTGSNTITFDNEISNTVSFNTPNTDSAQFISRYTTRGDVFYYVLAPKNLCSGSGIKFGTFTFTVAGDFGQWNQGLTETYSTNLISAFGYPESYSALSGKTDSYSTDGKTLTTTFGAISSGNRFWFSGVSSV